MKKVKNKDFMVRRNFFISDSQWFEIKLVASKSGITASEFIRFTMSEKVLELTGKTSYEA